MRWTRAALLASTLSIVVTTGCAAGPSDRPAVAVERPHAGIVETSTAPTDTPPPAPEVPKTDLAWHDCTVPTFNLLSLGTPPNGLILECAEYSTQVDISGAVGGNFRTAAMRARYDRTPKDVAPLVLTSGSDRASTATLAALAAGPSGSLLAARPIVAIDRRGIGSSQPVSCLTNEIRRTIADQAQFTHGTADPVDTVAKASQDATIACLDFLSPAQGTFDAAHAADDIDQLRKQWQVDHIALMGTGSGATVAMSYARKYGEHLGRLVLDSPQAVGLDSIGRAEQRVRGAEAALTAFAQKCVALKCSLGGDPRAAITDLVNRAGNGGFGDLSAAALVTTLNGFLGDPRNLGNPQITEFADALSALGHGDQGAITPLVLRETSTIANDGEYVNRCSDNHEPATPGRAKELAAQWGAKYQVFGKVGAIDLMACSAWPTPTSTALPEKLDHPVLVIGGEADPVAGIDSRPSVTGALGKAGARTATVVWQGWGHPTFAHSGCAQQTVTDYLKDAKLPQDGTACPA
ncbi:alpha/beta fold hydrolase [Nocardia sp. SYP-A9097]|uniref:alpha/beta hydrolase n=1 Tax=Nocardia sp. SYP-A9097 TaxID=2663237 RepID=UPI00129A2787|nr:alpha/beta hydrolase [Nocardia sp. SYP-A9097]MRH92892.1 alpha/beta fold hydrolase [Nocardia sp. SYP-A9097]